VLDCSRRKPATARTPTGAATRAGRCGRRSRRTNPVNWRQMFGWPAKVA